jgi:hypothetical protein
MKYRKNPETGQILEDKNLGEDFRKEPWIEGTKQEYDNYKKAKDLVEKKQKRKEELRQAHIDSQIQTQLNAVDNATTEEELNNI